MYSKYKPVQEIEAFQLTEKLALAVFKKEATLPDNLVLSGEWNPELNRVYSAYIDLNGCSFAIGNWLVKSNGIYKILSDKDFKARYCPME